MKPISSATSQYDQLQRAGDSTQGTGRVPPTAAGFSSGGLSGFHSGLPNEAVSPAHLQRSLSWTMRWRSRLMFLARREPASPSIRSELRPVSKCLNPNQAGKVLSAPSPARSDRTRNATLIRRPRRGKAAIGNGAIMTDDYSMLTLVKCQSV